MNEGKEERKRRKGVKKERRKRGKNEKSVLRRKEHR